jgi:sporulation protein YlmC with PRC-barrel domain
VSSTDIPGRLVRLADTDRTVADPEADVRGRTALDSNGEEIGTVEDLLVDEDADTVRFLRIGSGGFLGIGRDHFLVPVDAVTAVGHETVIVSHDRDRLHDVPGYDPELTYDRDYYAEVYGWWGYGPYWSPSYVPPPYPYGL